MSRRGIVASVAAVAVLATGFVVGQVSDENEPSPSATSVPFNPCPPQHEMVRAVGTPPGGETFAQIAARLGVDARKLADANGTTAGSRPSLTTKRLAGSCIVLLNEPSTTTTLASSTTSAPGPSTSSPSLPTTTSPSSTALPSTTSTTGISSTSSVSLPSSTTTSTLPPSSTSSTSTTTTSTTPPSSSTTTSTTSSTSPPTTTIPAGQSYLPEPFGFDRDASVVAANIQPYPQQTDGAEGKFRTNCTFSHNAHVDPIVAPGQVSAHLHSFFGNRGVTKDSTYQSLRQSNAGSTCAGGVLNNTAYWYPSVIDQNGKVRAFNGATVYYSCELRCSTTSEMPKGMKFVAGYDMTLSDVANTVNKAHFSWRCTDASGNELRSGGAQMPTCNQGERLYVRFSSPECWNGVNVDSTNHRNHIAYATYVNGTLTCPAGYPATIPVVTIQLDWTVTGGNSAGWYLSSDRMPGMTHANGSTWHADWFGAWEPVVQTAFMDGCLRAHVACNFDSLNTIVGQSGTKRLISPPSYSGSKVLDAPSIG